MRFSWIPTAVVVLVAGLCSAGSALAESLPHGGDITCNGPFSNKDTGESLMAQYKSQARIGEVSDLDGETGDGLLIYPDEPRARIEAQDNVGGGAGHLASLNLKEKNSLWTMGGLKLGMTLNELTAANAGPVTLSGFWQESETTFAMLGSLHRGDCELLVVFFAPEGVRFDHPLYGHEEIKSDDPRLSQVYLQIDQLILKFPESASH